MSDPLEEFVAAGSGPQRAVLRLMLALARRPRGAKLLAMLSPADHAAFGILAMAHYDDPAVARGLGWDGEAVAARGRELRRTERRP